MHPDWGVTCYVGPDPHTSMFERLSLWVWTIAMVLPSWSNNGEAGHVQKFGDEPAIEVHKPHKGLDLGDILWGWPISNTGDFNGIHFDMSFQENKT